jgi:nicotinamidase-related amidase
MSIPQNTALVVIDVQKGFDFPAWGDRNNPQAEDNIVRLIDAWRHTNRPVYFIRHDSVEPESSLRPGQVGNELKDIIQPHPDEPVIGKNVNSAFIGTDLESRLHEAGIESVVLVGLTTDHCVSTTTRMAANLGFNASVVSDATATFARMGHDGKSYSAEDIHTLALVSLNGEFASILTTDEVLEGITVKQ